VTLYSFLAGVCIGCDATARVAVAASICLAQTWLHGAECGRAVSGATMFRTGWFIRLAYRGGFCGPRYIEHFTLLPGWGRTGSLRFLDGFCVVLVNFNWLASSLFAWTAVSCCRSMGFRFERFEAAGRSATAEYTPPPKEVQINRRPAACHERAFAQMKRQRSVLPITAPILCCHVRLLCNLIWNTENLERVHFKFSTRENILQLEEGQYTILTLCQFH
jgi:hypothetical protein